MKLINMIPLDEVKIPLNQLPQSGEYSYVISQGYLKIYKQVMVTL